MPHSENLWAVGFDDPGRAGRVREELAALAEGHCLALLDWAVAVCYPDGSVTLDGQPFTPLAPAPAHGHGLVRFLAGLALGAPPLTAGAVGTGLAAIGGCSSTAGGIGDEFVSDVARLMRPGTSVLFLLDKVGDSEAVLQGIRGLGGTVLRANVDPERVRLIQAALSSG
jgi:uncharacterized membrane protein